MPKSFLSLSVLEEGMSHKTPDTHPRLICFVAMTTTSYVSNCQARSRLSSLPIGIPNASTRKTRYSLKRSRCVFCCWSCALALHFPRNWSYRAFWLLHGIHKPVGKLYGYRTTRRDFCSCLSDHRAGAVPATLYINVIIFLVSLTFYMNYIQC